MGEIALVIMRLAVGPKFQPRPNEKKKAGIFRCRPSHLASPRLLDPIFALLRWRKTSLKIAWIPDQERKKTSMC